MDDEAPQVLRFPDHPRVPRHPAVFDDTSLLDRAGVQRVEQSWERASEATGEFRTTRWPRSPARDERLLDMEERLGLGYWLRFVALGTLATVAIAVLVISASGW